MSSAKKRIIERFMSNVYGRKPDASDINSCHVGKYGHWLETQMGIAHNGNNAPDLFGYEMKSDTTSGRTTFGDWSPNIKIFGKNRTLSREEFTKIFGHPSPDNPHRWSWSGKPVPKIDAWNEYGQIMVIATNDDIQVIYDFDKDQRINKYMLVPERFQSGQHLLMAWTHDLMGQRVEDKFNQNGWFKCLTDSNGVYTTIAFGLPITFNNWLASVKNGNAFLDAGIYYDELNPNPRQYMSWRANNSYWNFLITERYPE